MGTRAVITFIDTFGRYSVYQHWDGDPDTVIPRIRNTTHRWRWPRYEADEYAAAYIATHKTGEGNIRLTRGPTAHGDLSYRYEVRVTSGDVMQIIVKGGDGKKLATHYTTPQTEEIDA